MEWVELCSDTWVLECGDEWMKLEENVYDIDSDRSKYVFYGSVVMEESLLVGVNLEMAKQVVMDVFKDQLMGKKEDACG